LNPTNPNPKQPIGLTGRAVGGQANKPFGRRVGTQLSGVGRLDGFVLLMEEIRLTTKYDDYYHIMYTVSSMDLRIRAVIL